MQGSLIIINSLISQTRVSDCILTMKRNSQTTNSQISKRPKSNSGDKNDRASQEGTGRVKFSIARFKSSQNLQLKQSYDTKNSMDGRLSVSPQTTKLAKKTLDLESGQITVKRHISPAMKRNKLRKRTKSAADLGTLLKKESKKHTDRSMSPPGLFFSNREEPPRQQAGLPPARELNQVWDLFVEESWRRSQKPQIMIDLQRQHLFQRMTVLILERCGLETIFEFLRPCKSLIALYLKGNRVITRDLVQIQHLVTLRKVDLSSNGIHFLPDEDKLQRLVKLEYLQLHKNLLVGWRQLQNLTCLKILRHMTLQGNPCAKIKGYRQFLVDNMPQLRSLDEFIVMDFEREDIATMYPQENIKKGKLQELCRFRPFNRDTTSWRSTRFTIPSNIVPKIENLDQSNDSHSSYAGGDFSQSVEKLVEESKSKHTVFSKHFKLTDDKKGIEAHLASQSYALRRKFEYCSPILTIQKTAKMFIYRKKYLRKQRMIKLMVWALNRWNLRSNMERMLRGMKLNRQYLFQIGRVRFIQKIYRSLARKWSICDRVAKSGQSIFRMKRVQDRVFERALGLRSRDKENHKTILLFKKSQYDLIQGIGLIEAGSNIQESKRFSFRKNVPLNNVEIRRSPLMNLVISSFRFGRILRAQSLFKQALEMVQQTQKQVTVLKLTGHDANGNNNITNIIQKSNQNSHERNGLPIAKQINSIIKPSLEPVKARHKGANRQTVEEVLQQPMINDDTALIEVTYEKDSDVMVVLRAMASYNRRHDEVIQIFYEPFLRKFEATLILQRWIKGVLFRKRQKPIFRELPNKKLALGPETIADRLITAENTPYAHYVLLERVARRIQRCYRKFSLRQRVNTLINIAKYVQQIESNKLYLEQSVYIHLESIFEQVSSGPWYRTYLLNQQQQEPSTPSSRPQSKKLSKQLQHRRSIVKNLHKPLYHEIPQSLFEKRVRFQINPKDHRVRVAYNAKVDKTNRYLESNLPQWFQRMTNTEIPKILNRNTPVISNGVTKQKKQPVPRFANKILSLIHVQPHAVNKGAPKVVNLCDLEQIKLEDDMIHTKMIKICLPTVSEARNRATVLALLTANYRNSSNSFVRMFTRQDFIGNKRSADSYEMMRGIQREYNILDQDKKTYIAPEHVTARQLHNGIIRKREEPYTTLLRARPKEKKTHFERFIVLGDADPRHVEERLGNALISNEVISKLQAQDSEAPNKHFRESKSLGKEKYNYVGSRKKKSSKSPKSKKRQMKKDLSSSNGFFHGQQNTSPIAINQQQQHSDWNESQPALQGGITPAELYQQKAKLGQNRDKISKIESLQRKLTRIRGMIETAQQQDSNFKSIFIKQLFPILEEKRELSKIDERERGQSKQKSKFKRRETMVINMPRADVDYFDPSVIVMDEDKIENQINNLFKEYRKQKTAYKTAYRLSDVLMGTQSAKKFDQSETTDQSPGSRPSASRGSLGLKIKQMRSDRSSIKMNDGPIMNIKVIGQNEDEISQMTDSKRTDQQKQLVLNRFHDLTDRVEKQNKAATEQDQLLGVNQRKIIKSKSTAALAKANLASSAVKKINKVIKMRLDNKIQGYLNKMSPTNSKSPRAAVGPQATGLIDYQNLPPNSSRNTKIPTLVLGKSTQRHSLAKDAGMENLVIDSTRNRFSPNRTGGMQSQRMSQVSMSKQQEDLKQIAPMSPQRRINGLRDSSSNIRMESNVQRLQVQAHKVLENNREVVQQQQQTSKHAKIIDAFRKSKASSTLLSQQTLVAGQLLNSQDSSLSGKLKNYQVKVGGAAAATAQSSNNYDGNKLLRSVYKISEEQQHQNEPGNDLQSFSAASGSWQLPFLGYRKRSAADLDKPIGSRQTDRSSLQNQRADSGSRAMSRNSKESTGHINRVAQVKTNEIFADLDDMRREREIAKLQNKQGKIQYMPLNNTTRSSAVMHRVLNAHNKEKDEPNHYQNLGFNSKLPQKNRMQMLLEQKISEINRQAPKMSQSQSNFRLKQQVPKKAITIPSSSRNYGGGNMTTIETIMRNRKQKAEDKTQILKHSGILDRKDLSQYLQTKEEDGISTPDEDAAPFVYQMQETVTPKDNMVGVSRSRSVNKFAIVNRKRVLSFLPQLTKQSVGKFTGLQ